MSAKFLVTVGVAGFLCGTGFVARGAAPLGTVFTYQGRLLKDGEPMEGDVDLEFRLFDASAGGSQVGETLALADVPLTEGLFTVRLNEKNEFGDTAFQGDARWLEIAVEGETLSPRQELTASPYALFARTAPWAGLLDVPEGFADGIDNVGGLVLPYAGTADDPDTAFAVTNTGTGNAIDATASGGGNAIDATASGGGIAILATAPGNGVALLGIGSVIGSTGAAGDASFGVRGEATNADGGITFGVSGESTSGAVNASGVFGLVSSPTGGTNGVWGQTSSSTVFTAGVYGEATASAGTGSTLGVAGTTMGDGVASSGVLGMALNETPAGSTYGVYGRSYSDVAVTRGTVGYASSPAAVLTFGVQGQTNSAGPFATGVYGLGFNATPVQIYGVRGQTNSTLDAAAGVIGQGNGVIAPGTPAAAALEIRNGAIRVSGTVRPAGTICPEGPGWAPIESCVIPGLCGAGDPLHSHTIGWFADLPLMNPLIIAGPDCPPGGTASMILATVETETPPPPWTSWYVQVHSKVPGGAVLRVSRMGSVLCECVPPGEPFWVHYLIINQAPAGVSPDEQDSESAAPTAVDGIPDAPGRPR